MITWSSAPRLMAQLGMCDAGGGFARYQHVETDPADAAIRVYRACGLAGVQGQLSLERPPA